MTPISEQIKSREKAGFNDYRDAYNYLDIIKRDGKMVVLGIQMFVSEPYKDEDIDLDGFSALSLSLVDRESYDYQYGVKTIDDLPILDGHVRYVSPDELGLKYFKFPNQAVYDFLDKLQVEIEGQ